jgi:hypothetical protein
MFDMIGHTFAQKTLVKIPNRGQNPRSQKGWFGFLARSPNFTIEVQNWPIRKLFVISGNTFFVIGGHSNFECKLAKNRVDCTVNSNRVVENLQLRPTFPDKRLIKTYDALWESCRSIAPLQLLCLEIFNLIATLGSYVFLNLRKWNKTGTRRRHHLALARARPRPAAWPRGARGGVRRTDAGVHRCGPGAAVDHPPCLAERRRPSLGKVEPANLSPSLVRISPTPFLHILTSPLEPAKPLAHLHGRPTRRSRGSGGSRSTLPPFSIAGAPPDAWNDKNRTPDEPTPLPCPFPAKFGLLLAGFRPSSSLSVVWTTLRGLRSF